MSGKIALLLLELSVTLAVYCQSQVDSAVSKLTNFPSGLFSKVRDRMAGLDRQLNNQTEKYMRRLAKREAKMQRLLYAQDSTHAAVLFSGNPQQQYEQLAQRLSHDSSKVFTSMGPEYLPYADSLRGTLAFLNKNPGLIAGDPAMQAKIQSSLAQMQQLQARLQDADAIKQYVQARKAQIQQYLSQYSHLPANITGAFQAYNKEGYYYAEQVRQYRAILNDPDKMMQKALSLLNNLPAFTSFMKHNSFLAGLFNVPDNYGSAEGLVGLQTRDQVLELIQRQVGQGGPNGASAIQQSLQSAQQDINKMRDKLSALGGGSGDMDMPGFKPNPQKTKTFWKRLELGTNLQTTRTGTYFPTVTDFGLSLGYKLNSNNTVGVGASYKLGWGNGINHIAFSSQGAGLRSFLDIRIKGSFSATGGLEYNYTTPFTAYQQIRYLHLWTQSGLIGVTKTVSMKSRVFKKTKLQLLWDFLSYQQVPKTQAILFRIGYAF